MKERLIVSTTTLVASLGSYLYAKYGGKDAVPYMMIGGFIGAVLGESLANLFDRDEDKKKKSR